VAARQRGATYCCAQPRVRLHDIIHITQPSAVDCIVITICLQKHCIESATEASNISNSAINADATSDRHEKEKGLLGMRHIWGFHSCCDPHLDVVLLEAVAAHNMAAVRQRRRHHLHARDAVRVLCAVGTKRKMIRDANWVRGKAE
jgi:hypothetical protein